MSRVAISAKRPMNISIAAGVAGTVAVTGTVVAVADDHPVKPRIKPVAFVASDSALTNATAQAQRRDAAAMVRMDQRLAAIKAAKLRARARHRAAAKRAAKAHRAALRAAARSFSRVDEHMSASAAHVLQIAAAQSGDSYVYGAAGPDQFDCSGFTQYVFGKVGISLPHSAAQQATIATPVSQPQPGDLVFVHNGSGGSIGHVAIYAGGGYWYEAANPNEPVGKHRAWSTNVTFGRVL
jgi:peptidoglycan DL-endopeptidase CwlO